MTESKKSKVILGVDPGTSLLGYGLIKTTGSRLELISLGTIDLTKFNSHEEKLKRIFERITWLLEHYKPQHCAIEAPFYGKNPQSMLKLGRAQGVAIAAAMIKDVPITEYSPKKIKVAVTGNGNASKEQVAAMLQQILSFKDLPKHKDATDGLAAAVCHHFQGDKLSAGSKSYKNWGAFIAANPEKLIR